MNKKIFYKVELEINEQAKSYLLSLSVDNEEHTTFQAAEVIENSIFTDACVLITRTMYDMIVSQARACQLLHGAESGDGQDDTQDNDENDRPKSSCDIKSSHKILRDRGNLFCWACGERLSS